MEVVFDLIITAVRLWGAKVPVSLDVGASGGSDGPPASSSGPSGPSPGAPDAPAGGPAPGDGPGPDGDLPVTGFGIDEWVLLGILLVLAGLLVMSALRRAAERVPLPATPGTGSNHHTTNHHTTHAHGRNHG